MLNWAEFFNRVIMRGAWGIFWKRTLRIMSCISLKENAIKIFLDGMIHLKKFHEWLNQRYKIDVGTVEMKEGLSSTCGGCAVKLRSIGI